MSSQNKLIVLVLLSLSLVGCGFEPLYGKHPGSSKSGVMAGVIIDSVPGRMGQQFRSDLEDRLNPKGAIPPKPAYRLNVTLATTTAAIGVARDGTVSRYNVYLDSNYTLYRNSDGKRLTTGSLRHVSSYNNVTNAYFSTYVSQQDALARGVTELAEIYRQRLDAFLTRDPSTIKPMDDAAPTPAALPANEQANPPASMYNQHEDRRPRN